MADPKHDNGACLDLGDEEQWVLHAAILQYLDRRAEETGAPTTGDADRSRSAELGDETAPDEKSENVLTFLSALEDSESLRLDRESLLLVRELLSEYLAGAPLRDRATCRSVLSGVRDKL